MDTRNNHLVAEAALLAMDLEDRKHYKPVPASLESDALRELAGRHEVSIPKNDPGRLAAWAKRDRNKAKRKRKAAKASRKNARK